MTKKICLISLALMMTPFLNAAQVMTAPDFSYSRNENFRRLETFSAQKHVFDYLCEQCKMPPSETMAEVYSMSETLGISRSAALEDIMEIFHLNVTAHVNYRTIEQLSLSLEQEWDKISMKDSKKK